MKKKETCWKEDTDIGNGIAAYNKIREKLYFQGE
jgi:hypothetical protein